MASTDSLNTALNVVNIFYPLFCSSPLKQKKLTQLLIFYHICGFAQGGYIFMNVGCSLLCHFLLALPRLLLYIGQKWYYIKRMIKLSKLTDYAFLVLLSLKDGAEQALPTTEISARSNIPGPTAAKILKILSKAGMIKSLRGPVGGYYLARRDGDISVGEVIEAFEGRIVLASCLDKSHEDCALESVCELSNRWRPMNQQLRALFFRWTLADLRGFTADPSWEDGLKNTTQGDQKR